MGGFPRNRKKKGEKRRNRSGRIPPGNWRARTVLVRIPYKISLRSARSTPPGCIPGPFFLRSRDLLLPDPALLVLSKRAGCCGRYIRDSHAAFSSTNLHRPSLFSLKITLFFRENLRAPRKIFANRKDGAKSGEIEEGVQDFWGDFCQFRFYPCSLLYVTMNDALKMAVRIMYQVRCL